jgi:DNA-binding LacI/PurR family transcriptional regulator
MGQIAAKTLIDRIEGTAEYVAEIAIEPELIVRASTSRAASHHAQSAAALIPR